MSRRIRDHYERLDQPVGRCPASERPCVRRSNVERSDGVTAWDLVRRLEGWWDYLGVVLADQLDGSPAGHHGTPRGFVLFFDHLFACLS